MSNKSEILALGCGGCGNNQLDTLLKLDRRYTGMFFNTNMKEMECLDTFDKLRRCFYIPNADGTGKDRSLTETYLKTEARKFADVISKFTMQKYVAMLSSANGGTGSKAVTMLPKLIKALSPDKVITSIATFPSLDETDIDFKNTIDFWNELMDCYSNGYVDNFMFIDNNKFDSEQRINKISMKYYDDIFKVVKDRIDSSDLARAFNEKGYNVVLKLDDRISNTYDAIQKAIDESVFFVPNNLECEVLVATVNINNFSIKKIKDRIPAYTFNKINETTEGETIIVLGGCNIPKEPVELAQESLRDLRERAKSKRSSKRDLRVVEYYGEKEEVKKYATEPSFTSKDLDDLFEDDSFWD